MFGIKKPHFWLSRFFVSIRIIRKFILFFIGASLYTQFVRVVDDDIAADGRQDEPSADVPRLRAGWF